MSADAKQTFIPNASQGDFWGGFMADAWFYKILAIFPLTGFFGIDKFVLRSPTTAIFKLLVNIFFLGAWYVYDIVQLLTDSEFVGKYGFSNIYGVSGHGYRFLSGISESKVDEYRNASPYNGGFLSGILYLFFLLTTLAIGFTGLPMILAGDFYGGLIKLFTNFLILPFVFNFVYQFIDFFKSISLEKDGISHPWPMYPMFTIFEKYPATYLLSDEQAKKELDAHNKKYEADIKAQKQPDVPAFLTSIFGKVFEAAKMYPPIAAFDTVTAARGAVSATSDMAQSAAKVGKELATAMEKRITKDPNAVIDKLLGMNEDPSTVPINKDPSALATENVALTQQRGGSFTTIPESFDTIMLIGMGVLIVGGIAAAVFRKFSVPRRQEDNEYPRKVYEQDDTPPQPGRV